MWNLSDPLENKNDANIKSGVVGSTGTNMPIKARPKNIKPNRTKSPLIHLNFIASSLT